MIADRVTDNVRALEGALIRVVAYHSLTQRPIDVALAEGVLDEIASASSSSRRQTSVDEIQQRVALVLRSRARGS